MHLLNFKVNEFVFRQSRSIFKLIFCGEETKYFSHLLVINLAINFKLLGCFQYTCSLVTIPGEPG